MTTVQLAQRLLRFLKIKDMALVPADDALGIMDAINGAIQEYYAIVPSAYKGVTMAFELNPAFQITATFTNGNNVFSGWNATIPAQQGFTIVVGSDVRQNTIVGTNTMLDIYTGPTGVQTAQVYQDCIHMDQIIERFTADPILVDYNRVLVRDENWRRIGVRSVWPGVQTLFPFGSYSFRQIRTPYVYWIEREAESQNGLPPFMLRCDSLPDVQYRVRIEGLLAPTQVAFNDLIVPAPLSLDQYTVESTVLPLAIYRLRTHPLWADRKIIPDVLLDYKEAVDRSKSKTPDQGTPSNFTRTPRGW